MDQTLKWFEEYKLIATIRSSSSDDAEEMIKAAMNGGFRIFEISILTPQALRIIESHSKDEGFLFGVGSICDGETAQRAINAGAKFLTSYYTDKDVISVAKNSDNFVIQSVTTPTELINASQLGADLIQIFPAVCSGGPEYCRLLKNQFSSIKLLAAGGVDLENFQEYLKHCSAVTIDRALFERPLVRTDNWVEIADKARQFTQKLEPSKTLANNPAVSK